MRLSNLRSRVFDKAVSEAGLTGLSPHGLRHTAASLAVASGASVLAVARMLGHKDPAMTLNVYADLFDDELDLVAERLHAAARADWLRPGRTDREVIPLAGGTKKLADLRLCLVPSARIELATHGLGNRCSIP
jgi:Phage integrase family